MRLSADLVQIVAVLFAHYPFSYECVFCNILLCWMGKVNYFVFSFTKGNIFGILRIF